MVFGITRSGSLMFMDSSMVCESSVAMYFKGGDTLYTVTISEDPTTKDLSATVVESSIGQSNHTLDLSPLFDSDGNSVSAVTDEFIAELQKAYEEKYSNCTAKVFNDVIIPLAIRKEASGYEIVLSIVSNNELGLAFVGYNFVIDTTLKTLAFTAKDAQLETTGDGSKFLSNDGTYKTVSVGESGVYRLPEAIMSLDESSTSDEIFTAWGGREVLLDFVKNYDASKAYIVSVFNTSARVTHNIQIHSRYIDDTNFVVEVYISIAGDNMILVTTVAGGLASASSFSAKTPMLTSTSYDVYFKYSTNDGELMWNNNNADTNTGGTGPRYAAYSRHKNVKIEDNGDGTQFLSNDGTYKAISSGAGNIYHLDLDISGYMSRATEAEQTAVWGKIYTAPTNENIITLLGGAEGIRQLCEKLKPTNNPIVTVPYMLYFLPTRLLSTSVSILIADSASLTNILSSPRDGCYINIALMFYTRINDPISIVVNLIIANFNTDTQQVSYEYLENSEFVHIEDSLNSSSTSDALSANQGRILKDLIDNTTGTTVVNNLTSTSTTSALSAAQGKTLKGLVDGKVGSSEITTIKKLTQSAYNSLSTKDSKTLYIIV